jgi:flavin-dependent dehydrogenase
LQRLGLADLAADGHLPSPGTAAAWADPEPVETDFLFSPYGPGWRLDRAAFDARLLQTAAQQGARILSAARLRDVHHGGGGWTVWADLAGRQVELHADFVVDATGRSAWFARRLGVARVAADRLVGIVGFLAGGSGDDARTFLDAAEDGWWYAARLPGNRAVAAFMTDSDLAAHYPGGPSRLWRDRLTRSPLIAAVVGPGSHRTALRVAPANGARLARVAGPDWVAAGDAAASWDPLSSQGIATALESGCRAAAVALACHARSQADYTAWIEANWAEYSRSYLAFYGQVRRWPGSVFWRRRMK